MQPDDFEISDYQNKPAGKLGFFVEKVYENRKSGMKIVDSIEKASIDANYYAGKLTKKILRNAMKLGLDYYLRLSNGEFNPENGKEKFVLSKKLYDSAHACINSINRNSAIQRILSQNLFLWIPNYTIKFTFKSNYCRNSIRKNNFYITK